MKYNKKSLIFTIFIIIILTAGLSYFLFLNKDKIIPSINPTIVATPSFQGEQRNKIIVDASSTKSILNHDIWSGLNVWVLFHLDSYQWLWPQIINKEGLKYARVSTIYSNFIPIYHEKNKKAEYDFTKADSEMDILINNGYTPLVTINEVPKELSSNPKATGSFVASGSIAPPKNYTKWKNLISETIVHWGKRYDKHDGSNRDISTWYFEGWNEPNSKQFWIGTQEEAFKLYDYTALGVEQAEKELGINIKLGGLGISREGWDWIDAFFQHIQNTGSRLDFVTYHYYSIGGKNSTQLWNSINSHSIADSVVKIHQFMDKYPEVKSKPVLMTEWNIDGTATYPGLNTDYNASFITRVVKSLVDINQLKIAFFTGAYSLPYTHTSSDGRLGLYTTSEWKLAKTSARAFELLNLLGTQRVQINDEKGKLIDYPIGGIATIDNNKIVILLYNHKDINPNISAKKQGQTLPVAKFALDVKNLPFKVEDAQIRVYKLDSENANSLTAWQKAGSPKNIDSSLSDKINSETEIKPEIIPLNIKQDNNLTINVNLPTYGVYVYEITSKL